jgi:hypothetical protein
MSQTESMSSLSLSLQSIVILSSRLCLSLPSGLCIMFPYQVSYALLFPAVRAICPIHLVLFDLITFLVRKTNHEAPHHALFSILLSLVPI